MNICKKILPFLCMALLLSGCGYAGPEKAVRQELDLIQQLDETTIQSFVAYEDIQASADQTNAGSPDEEAAESIRLFFENFSYHIDSSTQSKDGTEAEVTVSITNLDAEELAKDLCRELYRRSLDYGSDSEQQTGLTSSFALMKECLETRTYSKKTTTAVISLKLQDGVWTIQDGNELEDALVGGLVSYLSDPYLLSPEEILDLTLEPFRTFSETDWQSYLGISDLFSVGNDCSDEIDQAFFSQLAQHFNYEIREVTQDGDTATADVLITSLDLNAVTEQCLQPLIDYAHTTASIRATDEEVAARTAEILLQALAENTSSTETAVSITLYHDEKTWDAVLDEEFTQALLGDLNASLASLQEASASVSELQTDATEADGDSGIDPADGDPETSAEDAASGTFPEDDDPETSAEDTDSETFPADEDLEISTADTDSETLPTIEGSADTAANMNSGNFSGN